ncbi:MAG: AAA family ATPase [Ignavibacteriae bacterium]|nr:AAA family ATPase [Ignavibacteriota bacterium]
MKRKHKHNENDSRLLDGSILNSENEVNIERICKVNNQNISIPLHQRRLQFFEFDFIKSYLYALHTGIEKDAEINVASFITPISSNNPGITPPTIYSGGEDGLLMVSNEIVHTTILYKDKTYHLSVYSLNVSEGMCNSIRFIVSTTGAEPLANYGIMLTDYLIKQSIKNSRYKNKILKIAFDYEQRVDIKEIGIGEFKSEKLENLFVPDNIRNELERFSACVEKFKDIKLGLRYLLCGEPGTGKTKVSRIITNRCYKKATIILAEGIINFKNLFEFSSLFSPAIIIVDDIDLCFGSRDFAFSANGLAEFLGTLDGFLKNSNFLIATTNDKAMVDDAAKRPGRFDAILDFKHLNKTNYMEIVKSNTDDKDLVKLFDEDILKLFQKQRVVGAFLVNLVKQLKIVKTLYPDKNLVEFITEYADFSHRGFYQNQQTEVGKVGF